jgi:hypothetical protein
VVVVVLQAGVAAQVAIAAQLQEKILVVIRPLNQF